MLSEGQAAENCACVYRDIVGARSAWTALGLCEEDAGRGATFSAGWATTVGDKWSFAGSDPAPQLVRQREAVALGMLPVLVHQRESALRDERSRAYARANGRRQKTAASHVWRRRAQSPKGEKDEDESCPLGGLARGRTRRIRRTRDLGADAWVRADAGSGGAECNWLPEEELPADQMPHAVRQHAGNLGDEQSGVQISKACSGGNGGGTVGGGGGEEVAMPVGVKRARASAPEAALAAPRSNGAAGAAAAGPSGGLEDGVEQLEPIIVYERGTFRLSTISPEVSLHLTGREVSGRTTTRKIVLTILGRRVLERLLPWAFQEGISSLGESNLTYIVYLPGHKNVAYAPYVVSEGRRYKYGAVKLVRALLQGKNLVQARKCLEVDDEEVCAALDIINKPTVEPVDVVLGTISGAKVFKKLALGPMVSQ
ncbi:hypothetical protein WJX81_002078 [Elliptochloris bilobata]|uniref:Uncharacterized protein n=1 Tax=Elliptochloris bilobata TaxID=381761 RepID=A0AAW1QWD9_9CHLO